MLQSKRAIDRSDHLLEEIKTDDKAATNATNGMENGEKEKHRFAVRSSLRSNDAPELISLPLFLRPIMLSSLSLKPQNKMSPSGMAAWQEGAGATGFAFNSEERGKEKSSKRTERGVWCGQLQ